MRNAIQKWGITLYLLLLSLHLYAQVFGKNYILLQVYTKFLLVPILILYLISQDYFHKSPKDKWLVILALTSSFMGDVLLTIENYFILGMVAFMITHIFNIVFFNHQQNIVKPKSKKFYGFLILLFVFCCFIFNTLKPAMGMLIYPVTVYMAFICISALMSIHAGGHLQSSLLSKLFWFPGMLFFIISDTVLAFNKFDWSLHHPIKNIGLVIMLTYGIAQLLLVKGFQLYFKQQAAAKE